MTQKNDLGTISFIAGDYQELQYNIVDITTGQPVDISSARSVTVAIFSYGDNITPIAQVSGDVVRIGDIMSGFKVVLPASITKNLAGLYIHQPIIEDNEGKVFRPAQGILNIIPRAYEENALTNI